MQVTIGGNRLGSGNRNKVTLREYERSTHDLSYVWRSTMAAGTLVPFMTEVALPGDTFDIDLNCDVLTHPTIGPLFGSYKIQLDVFQLPIRLYQGKLHMNMLGIGLDMSKVPLPQIRIKAMEPVYTKTIDNQQINPSCIFSYLGIRGLAGSNMSDPGDAFFRKFNAIPFLGYWDIYKNYYANKQEEIGAVIHQEPTLPVVVITAASLIKSFPTTPWAIPIDSVAPWTYTGTVFHEDTTLEISGTGITEDVKPEFFRFFVQNQITSQDEVITGDKLFEIWQINTIDGTILAANPIGLNANGARGILMGGIGFNTTGFEVDTEPSVETFPLANIDTMRQNLLSWFGDTPYDVDTASIAPYGLPFKTNVAATVYSQLFNQEGLALKTYNSDLFNNWIDTEWIDGVDGISAVTAIDTSGGSFTIDELNLSKKIYDMLNRIAISGGSYDDWLDTVYTHERQKSAENPMYLGGLIQRLAFQEVVSNSASPDQPLGTLAGRGTVTGNGKGGKVIAKIDEPSYLMGIISLTPIIDYSQGNKWDTNLTTVNDLHKPALDEIGFQDLITDQMAWFDTKYDDGNFVYKSAGKQPAWINYMTNVNKVLGNFADQTQQMFMVLNRRYEVEWAGNGPLIKDLTTYIDPTKFNHIFADTRRDAQNFWAQIGVNITARRKMSAKVIPNL